MSNNELAIRRDTHVSQTNAALPATGEWNTMREMATALVESGLLPQHVKTPQAALAIMLKGREIGVPAMQALSNIVVIQGKPTCNAEIMNALIYRDHGDHALRFIEATNDVATLEYKRRSWTTYQQFSFTIADAKQAGLQGGNWAKYPAAMLRARCISAVARMAFADSIGGMYTPEELGAAVTVEDGDRVVFDAAPQQTRQQRPQATPAPVAEVIDNDTGEVVEARAKEAAETFVLDADEIIQWLDQATERAELREIRTTINANGLTDNPQVKAAYTTTWERLTGKRAPSRDEAASMGQQATFVK